MNSLCSFLKILFVIISSKPIFVVEDQQHVYSKGETWLLYSYNCVCVAVYIFFCLAFDIYVTIFWYLVNKS